MRTHVIFAPHAAIASSVAIAKDLLWMAVRAAATDGTDRDRVLLVTIDGAPAVCGGEMVIAADAAITDVEQCTVLWVAGFWSEIDEALEQNAPALPWLSDQHRAGARIAGHGPASFLLAQAGLLDGRIATTYPSQANAFRARFPAVDVQPARAITDAGGVHCAIGITSGGDLLVTLIELEYGPRIAAAVAASALMDSQRSYRVAPATFDGQKYHGDEQVLAAQLWLEARYDQPVTIAALADRVGLSARTLTRRFNAAVGEPPNTYLQRVRVEAAKDLLRDHAASITEIAWRVGYRDTGAFHTVFAKHTGQRPGEFRASTPPDPR